MSRNGICLVRWGCQCQRCYRTDVVERHRSDNHKRCHTGLTVNVDDEGDAKDCCTAALGGLYELAAVGFIL